MGERGGLEQGKSGRPTRREFLQGAVSAPFALALASTLGVQSAAAAKERRTPDAMRSASSEGPDRELTMEFTQSTIEFVDALNAWLIKHEAEVSAETLGTVSYPELAAAFRLYYQAFYVEHGYALEEQGYQAQVRALGQAFAWAMLLGSDSGHTDRKLAPFLYKQWDNAEEAARGHGGASTEERLPYLDPHHREA